MRKTSFGFRPGIVVGLLLDFQIFRWSVPLGHDEWWIRSSRAVSRTKWLAIARNCYSSTNHSHLLLLTVLPIPSAPNGSRKGSNISIQRLPDAPEASGANPDPAWL